MNESTDSFATPWPTVDILLLNWNGRQLLQQFLPALDQLQYPGSYQLVLVDNGSTDDSLSFVQQQYPHIRCLANGRNLGFSRGMNQGLRQSQAELVVLLNTDVEVQPDWLTELARPFRHDPTIGITGAKLYYPDGRLLQHAGATLDYPLGLGQHRFYRQADHGQADEQIDVPYVTGAAMAIHRRLIDKIGLLDEAFAPFYYEEVDYCTRAIEAGFRVLYVPTAVAIHHESLTMGSASPRQFYDLNRNRLYYLIKHQPASSFLEPFVPAEQAYLQNMPTAVQMQLMRRAYLNLILTLPTLNLSPADWLAWQQALVTLAEQASTQKKGNMMNDYWLFDRATLQERPFASDTPVIGPLIAWFRSQWNNVATKWYVRPLLQQQNEYNQLLAQAIQDHDSRLIAQDHEQTELTRQLAELTLQIKQMNQRLAALEQQQFL